MSLDAGYLTYRITTITDRPVPMMRVLLDTNVVISNLSSSAPATSASSNVIAAALAETFTLLLLDGVVEELERKLRDRPDLSARINPEIATDLVDILRSVAEPIAEIAEPYPRVARDPGDDFLLAHAVLRNADWIVTWDKDVLVLDHIEGLQIGTPPEFLASLRGAGLISP